jgi:uncharacterized protein YegL
MRLATSNIGSWSGRPHVMPFYLLCDVSLSMRFEIEALNDAVSRLWDAILTSPVLHEGTRVCIITFSDEAKVRVPLTQMSAYPGGPPDFTYEDLTNYGAAFRVLAEEIAEDYRGLQYSGFDVYRPCAYFLTDGAPNDHDWHETFTATLTKEALGRLGMPEPPIFVPFGFREAQTQILCQLAYPMHVAKWYHSKNATIEQALDGLLGIIMNSVLLSSQSMLRGTPGHILPPPDYGSNITWHDAGYDGES